MDNDGGEIETMSDTHDERRRKLLRELERIQRSATNALSGVEGGPPAAGQHESSADALAVIESVYAIAQRIDDVLRMAVGEASEEGHSWNEIGLVLDIDREEAKKRYGGV